MNKVFISRSDGNIPWGFRLQGGLEDNAPLTVTNVSVCTRMFSIWKKQQIIVTSNDQSMDTKKPNRIENHCCSKKERERMLSTLIFIVRFSRILRQMARLIPVMYWLKLLVLMLHIWRTRMQLNSFEFVEMLFFSPLTSKYPFSFSRGFLLDLQSRTVIYSNWKHTGCWRSTVSFVISSTDLRWGFKWSSIDDVLWTNCGKWWSRTDFWLNWFEGLLINACDSCENSRSTRWSQTVYIHSRKSQFIRNTSICCS